MSWFSSFMHPGRAYKKAGQQEQMGYDQANQMRQPWIQQGQQAGGNLMDQYSKLMNLGQLQDEWSKGYETSPYAQQLMQQNQTQGMDTASAMGLGGSSAALSNIQQGAGNIMQKDRQQYMNDLMQKYMMGAGIGENMYGTGAQMAGQGAQGAQQHGEWQGQNKFNQNNAGGSQMMQMLPMVMAMIMGKNPMGGGGNDWSNQPNMPFIPSMGFGG